MKPKLRNLLACLTIPLVGVQLGLATAEPINEQPKKEWKVSVYLDGDDYGIDRFAFHSFNQLEKVGSNEIIDIYAQLDGYYLNHKPGTKRYHVLKDDDMQKIKSKHTGSDKELNMGAYSTFKDFVEWIETHDTKRHMIAINCHGFGIMIPLDEIADDQKEKDDDQNNALPTYVIDKVFDESIRNKLELIVFDSCQRATIEVAYQLREHAKIMVASEANINVSLDKDRKTVLFSGMEYDKILEHIVQNPDIDTKELGKFIIKSYLEAYFNNPDAANSLATLSAINLENINDFVERFSEFSDILIKRMEDEKTRHETLKTLKMALKETQRYPPAGTFRIYTHVDLFDFLKNIDKYSNDKKLKNALKTLNSSDIIMESHYKGDTVKNSNGVSILFIEHFDNIDESNKPSGLITKKEYVAAMEDYYGKSDFAEKTRWDKVQELFRKYSQNE